MDFGQKWKNIQCHLDQFEAQWQPWGRPSWGRLAIQMRRRCFDLGQFFSPSKPLTHTHSHPLGKAQHFQSLSWIWFLQNADGKYLFVWCFQVGCLGGLCHLWTNHAWPHSQVSNIQIYFMIIKLSSNLHSRNMIMTLMVHICPISPTSLWYLFEAPINCKVYKFYWYLTDVCGI